MRTQGVEHFRCETAGDVVFEQLAPFRQAFAGGFALTNDGFQKSRTLILNFRPRSLLKQGQYLRKGRRNGEHAAPVGPFGDWRPFFGLVRQ